AVQGPGECRAAVIAQRQQAGERDQVAGPGQAGRAVGVQVVTQRQRGYRDVRRLVIVRVARGVDVVRQDGGADVEVVALEGGAAERGRVIGEGDVDEGGGDGRVEAAAEQGGDVVAERSVAQVGVGGHADAAAAAAAGVVVHGAARHRQVGVGVG